jgi:DHA2 family multidrug resistance protein
MLNDRTNLHFLRAAEHLTSNHPAMLKFVQRVATHEAVARGGDTLAGYAAALKVLGTLALREAQTESFADTFFAIALCFLVVTPMVPLMRRLAGPATPGRDAH